MPITAAWRASRRELHPVVRIYHQPLTSGHSITFYFCS
jgi:hypothetical protein